MGDKKHQAGSDMTNYLKKNFLPQTLEKAGTTTWHVITVSSKHTDGPCHKYVHVHNMYIHKHKIE
jgi:hypothetical protein